MTKELIEEARQQAAYLSNGHSKLLRRLADALAARQPTEDGTGRVEAWHRIAAHPAFSGCIRGDMPLIDSMTERLDSLSRAAVPDAATEALLQTERRDVLRFEDMAVDAMAERDAALAAVERVRAIHVRDTPSIGGDWCLDDHHKWPCPTVAALDGAPEPEVKP